MRGAYACPSCQTNDRHKANIPPPPHLQRACVRVRLSRTLWRAQRYLTPAPKVLLFFFSSLYPSWNVHAVQPVCSNTCKYTTMKNRVFLFLFFYAYADAAAALHCFCGGGTRETKRVEFRETHKANGEMFICFPGGAQRRTTNVSTEFFRRTRPRGPTDR